MSRKRWSLLAVLSLAGLVVLLEFPYYRAKQRYAWVIPEIRKSGSFSVQAHKRGNVVCYVSPNNFAVSEARTLFPGYQVEPWLSDAFMDSNSTWTLLIASQSQRRVALLRDTVANSRQFPDETVCGSEINFTFERDRWSVSNAPKPAV